MNGIQNHSEQHADESTQVLTFGIADQSYCIELEYVTEIIDSGDMTTIPDTPVHVEGVMDLRGQTTTIVNPLVLLEGESLNPEDIVTDGGEETHRITMLDERLVDSDGALGWLVSSVSAVDKIPIETLEAEGLANSPMFRGVVKQDDNGFLIWLDPEELTV